MMIKFRISVKKKVLHCHSFYTIIKIYITTHDLNKIITKNHIVNIIHYVCNHIT